jgi:hypothetical protein
MSTDTDKLIAQARETAAQDERREADAVIAQKEWERQEQVERADAAEEQIVREIAARDHWRRRAEAYQNIRALETERRERAEADLARAREELGLALSFIPAARWETFKERRSALAAGGFVVSVDTDKLIARLRYYERTKGHTGHGVCSGEAASALEQARAANTGLTVRATENAVRLAEVMKQRDAAEANLARAREALAAILTRCEDANQPFSQLDIAATARAAFAAGSGE